MLFHLKPSEHGLYNRLEIFRLFQNPSLFGVFLRIYSHVKTLYQ